MKKIVLVSLVTAFSLLACKKENYNQHSIEGANIVATQVGFFKNDVLAPKLWFTGNFKQLMMGITEPVEPDSCSSVSCNCDDMTLKLTTSYGFAIISTLRRLGNSPNYRSDNFNIPESLKFRLVNVYISYCNGTSYYQGQIFVYESGQTIEQRPQIANVEKIGEWIHPDGTKFIETMLVTISGDPIQEVESLVFVPNPVKVATNDPIEPFKIVQLPAVELEKTHFSQSSGMARFSSFNRIKETYGDDKKPWEWTGGGVLYFRSKGKLLESAKAESVGGSTAEAGE